jgi:hypothetical protein
MEFGSNVNYNNNEGKTVMNAPGTKTNKKVTRMEAAQTQIGTKMDCENTTDKASSEK